MAIEELRIFDKDGNLKKTVSSEECSKHFWKESGLIDKIMNSRKERRKYTKKILQNWVCEDCRQIFKATKERSHCYSPCVPAKDSTTRVDRSLGSGNCEKCKKRFPKETINQVCCKNNCIRIKNKKPLNLHICTICKEKFKHKRKKKLYCEDPCNKYTAFRIRHE